MKYYCTTKLEAGRALGCMGTKHLQYINLARTTAAKSRAGGNGTACTAMAVLVFEGEKWRRLVNLRYRISSPSALP